MFLALALILAYVLWLSYHLLTFHQYSSPHPKEPPFEIEGAYHVHTTFSDGQKLPDEITKSAEKARIDFILLTDHGSPNSQCWASQGWNNKVLVLAGSELSVNRGHLAALGFVYPSHPFSQIAEEAASQISSLDGFSIIAHPYSKVHWSWGQFAGYSGIELINADTMAKRNLLLSLPFLPALLVDPKFVLIKMLDDPGKNLRKWDDLNRQHQVYGYFSVDAHFLYRPLFSFLHLHAILENPLSKDFETAKHQVHEALKRGRFYNAVDAAAQARGFRFWGEAGKKKIPMGESIKIGSPVIIHIQVPFPFAKETLVIHNGRTLLRSSQDQITLEAADEGVYRVEVYLKGRTPLNRRIPWIVSNPIFLRRNDNDWH